MTRKWLILLLAATVTGCDIKGVPSGVTNPVDQSASTPAAEFKQAGTVISDLTNTLKAAQATIPQSGAPSSQGYRTANMDSWSHSGWVFVEDQADGTVKRSRKVQKIQDGTVVEDIDQTLEYKDFDNMTGATWARRTEVVNTSATKPIGTYVMEGKSLSNDVDLTSTFTNTHGSRSYKVTQSKVDSNTTKWVLVGELPDGGKANLNMTQSSEPSSMVDGKWLPGKFTFAIEGTVTTHAGATVGMERRLESSYSPNGMYTETRNSDSWKLVLHPNFNLIFDQVAEFDGKSSTTVAQTRTLLAMVKDDAGSESTKVDLAEYSNDFLKYPTGIITYADSTKEEVDFAFAGDLNAIFSEVGGVNAFRIFY